MAFLPPAAETLKSTASTKRCTKEFTESPLVLFSETIAPRLAEEMNTNPKSPAAKQLANALRKVQLHVMKVKNPELAAKIGSSLSQAINEIEKRHSVK